MLRDITLGQYYQTDSIIHRLDPRLKIIATLIFIISIFIFTNPYVYLLCTCFLLCMIVMSKVPFRFMVRGMKPIFSLLVITIVFNMFLTPGETIYSIWKLHITREGLRTAIYMGYRLIVLILGSSLMTLTTTPNQLTDGLESVMNPLKIVKVPVHEMAMMMSIALRFIPILMDETDKIIKAQTARGAHFDDKNLIKRAKSVIPVLIPLFVSAFRRANDLAMAMEARCYRGGEGRTKMKPLKYESRDFVGYIIILLYLAGLIAIGIISKTWPYGAGI